MEASLEGNGAGGAPDGEYDIERGVRWAWHTYDAFDFTGDSIIVTRVNEEYHEDPAITGFLALLEKDISAGQHITTLPDDLARSMLAALGKRVELSADIDGDVVL